MRSTPAVPLRIFHLWFEGNLCVHCSRFPVLRYELSIGRVFFFFTNIRCEIWFYKKSNRNFWNVKYFFPLSFLLFRLRRLRNFDLWLFKFRFIYNNLITMMVILLKFCFVVKYRKGVDIFGVKFFELLLFCKIWMLR